jgi:ribose transport system permease protein
MLGVLLGALLMQIARSGLVLLGFSAYWQALIIGAMILAAIFLDYWQRRKSLP